MKPAFGAWMLSKRIRVAGRKPWATLRGTVTKPPGPYRRHSPSRKKSTSPSSTKNESTWSSWVCGSTPSKSVSYDSTIASYSGSSASTRWLPSRSPSSGGSETGSIAGKHDVRRAARALGVLVPRRRVAAGGAGGDGGRARLRGARAHRPRRRLRIARVRACGEALRRAPDHRRGDHARQRRTRDAARRKRVRLREPVPPAHRGACRHPPQGEPRTVAAVARPVSA